MKDKLKHELEILGCLIFGFIIGYWYVKSTMLCFG